MGLKTGWGDSGNIIATLAAFALMGRGRSRHEHNVAQTIAAAAAAAAFSVGLVSTFPALALLGRAPSPIRMLLWGLSLTVLGTLFGARLRGPLIVDEQLPFPTGTATAEIIESLHQGRRRDRRLVALVVTALIAATVVWFRDGAPRVLPATWAPPLTIGGLSAAALSIGVPCSPALFGIGLIVGRRIAVSVGVGAVIAWGGLAPWLIRTQRVEATYTSSVSWLIWPALSMIVGSTVASLLLAGRAQWRGVGLITRLGLRGGDRRSVLGLLAAALLLIILAKSTFGVSMAVSAAAVGLSLLLAGVCARATGETDVMPVTQLGQLTQLLFGFFLPGQAVGGIVASQIVSGNATQSSFLLIALKSGARLHTPPADQRNAQLLGGIVGVFAATAAYALVVRVYGVGSAGLPAPAALAVRSLAAIVGRGVAGIPPAAIAAAVAAGVAGAAMVALERTAMRKLTPSSAALAVGMLIPSSYALAIVVAALVMSWLEKRKYSAETMRLPIATGLIAGEALIGISIAACVAGGWLPSP